jgi:hypothetical protein
MDYFYLKLGRGNAMVQAWLAGLNPLKCPAAPIYFDNLTKADYDAGQGGKEPREFVRRGTAPFDDRTLMVVVHGGEVWVLKPAGAVRFLPSEPNEEGHPHTPKAMPVEIVARRLCKDVPPVLAGIGANQYYARGTFRPLNDWGNFKAVDWVANRVGQGEHWNLAENGADQLLECLGSTELETLVARLFEAHGCFVPAHRGGMMKDIDLFAHNDTAVPIRIGNMGIPAGGNLSIQVKRWADGALCPSEVDCLIGLGVVGPKTVNAETLIELVREKSVVRQWLRRSLNWLPQDLLGKFQLGGQGLL